jgi:hypothetical protein
MDLIHFCHQPDFIKEVLHKQVIADEVSPQHPLLVRFYELLAPQITNVRRSRRSGGACAMRISEAAHENAQRHRQPSCHGPC